MVALPRSLRARNLTWKIALLPLLAIVTAAALELALGGGHVAQGPTTVAAAPPAQGILIAPPSVGKARAPFSAPAGVAVRGTTVYISDVATSTIWSRDLLTGVETLIAGSQGSGYSGDGGPAGDAQLTEPRGLALDAAGNLFIADSGNHAIRKIALDGIISTVAGDGIRGFSGDGGSAIRARLDTPAAVAIDSKGNLYIADTLNHRIRKVNRAGVIVTVAGSGAVSTVGHGTGGFGFSGDGGPAVSAQLSLPEGVAIDSLGNLFIADTGNDRIRKVDLSGVIRTIAGTGRNAYAGNGGPAVRANLYAPVGIAIGADDSVYFSERYQDTIRVITPRGLIGLVAGRGGVRGDGGDGGAAKRAKLDDPQGIAFGPGGELYLADTGNRRVRVVAANGLISTIS
jgi:trimeric autotransporter adhesin